MIEGEVINRGHPRCDHQFVGYMRDVNGQIYFCLVPGCNRTVSTRISFESVSGGQLRLPPKAYLDLFGGFFTRQTDEDGYINGPLPEEDWKRTSDITQRFDS